jgi:hypothetical protein
MRHSTILIFCVIISYLFVQCHEDKTPVEAENEFRNSQLGDVDLYTFSSDSIFPIGNPSLLKLPSNSKIIDVLDTLSAYLAQNYFYKTYTGIVTNIKFEVKKVDEIYTPIRPFRIATIDFIDPEELATGYFFQGSHGGYVTYAMLAANFTQPQLVIPILDGLVVLYNGRVLEEMDHIRLDRIIVPGDIRQVVLNSFNKK